MNEARIIDEIRTSTGWSVGVIRDVVTALKQRGLLIDDAVVGRVGLSIGAAYRNGLEGKTGLQLATDALFPPKPDPFEVAALEALGKLGYSGDLDYFKRSRPNVLTTMVEALRKAPKP